MYVQNRFTSKYWSIMLTRLQFQLRQKIHYSLVLPRYLSSSPGTSVRNVKQEISVVDINENVRIFQHSTPSPSPRPLVLLFGWLFAKPKHLKKFADIYINQGFDVISVRVFLQQLLRPKSVQCLVRCILDLCEQEGRKSQQMLVHALSAGGYMYGEMLASFEEYPTKYANVSGRLRGQIFDSVFHVDGIPRGFSRAVTYNKSLSDMIELTIKWCWARFPSASSAYRKAYDACRNNKLKLPSIFFSINDPLCDPGYFLDMATEWRALDVYAVFHIWDDAPHVGIYQKHKEHYEQIVINFIRMTGIKSVLFSKL